MLGRIDEHEVLNVEDKLATDHKALTITIKINDEVTTTNKKDAIGIFKSKFTTKEWEHIAEMVENNIAEERVDMDVNDDNNTSQDNNIDSKWIRLKNIIIKEIANKRKDNITKEPKVNEKYCTDVKGMSECDRQKTKIKVIKEIEKCINAWDKLVIANKKIDTEMRRDYDVMEKAGAKERKIITNYKKLVHRFTDLCNAGITLDNNKESMIYDGLEDNKKLAIVKVQLEKEKNRLLSDLDNIVLHEQSMEIEKNIENREKLMTSDLKEMIIRIMDKRKGQIKIDSCLQIQGDRVKMITNHEDVKKEVKEHFRNWTCERKFDESEYEKRWRKYYEQIEEINEQIYVNLCDEVTLQECELVLRSVKYDKAAGASGIPYDFWKKSGKKTREVLIDIINQALKEGIWPKEWKDGIIYPIKKTMERNRDLILTRPITLIETARKIAIKILTNRLSGIITKHEVLRGKNYAALKYESTFEPIKILQGIIEDANINKKEARIVLMDISKAYDSVSFISLKKAMERIKLPEQWINLVLDISLNRFNRVIVNNDLTEEYKVEDGIDQGEVWSPLLWRIFYDPLLCKLDDIKEDSGYEMSVEYKENITKSVITTHSIKINAIAFMDDTTLISKSYDKMVGMLEICHSFYKLNDIKANPKKYEIIRINDKENRDMIIEDQKIDKINSKNGNRFWGSS